MTVRTHKKFTLMPAISLATLALLVAVPTLSSVRLHAASPTRYATVVVNPGDSLWSIAAAHSGNRGIQSTVDRISAANHLAGVLLQPGQRLRIPE